jgi:hypothetical protein
VEPHGYGGENRVNPVGDCRCAFGYLRVALRRRSISIAGLAGRLAHSDATLWSRALRRLWKAA